jgi:hypothetical protein
LVLAMIHPARQGDEDEAERIGHREPGGFSGF